MSKAMDAAPVSTGALLEIDGLTLTYGGTVAVDNVSYSVMRNEICGLIGPNGAGKTSLFNCVSRLAQPTKGSIRFDGADLLAVPAEAVMDAGIGRTFQNVLLLEDLTIEENISLGVAGQRRSSVIRAVLGTDHRGEAEAMASTREVMADLGLSDVANERPGELPFGTLKRAELARAVVGRPKLLMLDEPANGLTAAEVHELGTVLVDIRDRFDLSILLVEHHMGLVQRIADHAVVLDSGRLIADGTPAWACSQPRVIEAYLGTAA